MGGGGFCPPYPPVEPPLLPNYPKNYFIWSPKWDKFAFYSQVCNNRGVIPSHCVFLVPHFKSFFVHDLCTLENWV